MAEAAAHAAEAKGNQYSESALGIQQSTISNRQWISISASSTRYEQELMPRLLGTMAASGDGLRMRLILVDNASAGVEPWCGYFPDTQIVRNARRLPYAANLNRILDASTARYVLLMNTDMYFDPPRAMPGENGGLHGRPAALRHVGLPALSRRRFRRLCRPAFPEAAVDPCPPLWPRPPAAAAPSPITSTPNTPRTKLGSPIGSPAAS